MTRVGPYWRDTARHYAGQLGRALGWTARRLGIAEPATRAALSVLRRLEPGHPLIARAEAAERARRDTLLAEMYADPQHPLRVAADHARAARRLSSRDRGYPSSAEPVTELPRMRSGPGPGGRRPGHGASEGDPSL